MKFFLALAVLAAAGHVMAAENKVALSDLARAQGIWKAEFKDPQGNARVAYDWRWQVEPLQVMRHVRFTLDADTKHVVDEWAGFVTVDPNQQQFQGLYFGSAGWVGETTSVPTDKGHVVQVSITGTNRSHFRVTVHEEYESDTAFVSTSKGVMYAGNYVERGEVYRFQKVDRTLLELMDSGQIVFPEVDEPIAALAPLSRLVGRWRSADDSGTISHDLRWNLRMGKKWLIERWQIGGESGSGGFNVSGIDPVTGMLSLWSIGSNFMGKSGRWDVISDKILGQVQGNSRLVREFPDDNTFKAHWQVLRAGSFVDVPADQAERYTAKRLPGGN